MSLHLSKCHIVGNHMSQLNCPYFIYRNLQLGKALSNLLSYRDYIEIVLVASLVILLFVFYSQRNTQEVLFKD